MPSEMTNEGLGLVLTGFMEKKNPYGRWNRRFLVLTQEGFHWFKRESGYDLFGEERGHIAIVDIESMRTVDRTMFEVVSTDKRKRQFRIAQDSNSNAAEEWVHAYRCVTKENRRSSNFRRRQTLSNIHGSVLDSAAGNIGGGDGVVVRIVSLRSAQRQNELILARNPSWERVVLVPGVQPGDELVVSMSNGGLAVVSFESLLQHEAGGDEFDAAIEGGPAGQTSLKLSVVGEVGSGVQSVDLMSPSLSSPLSSQKVSSESSKSQINTCPTVGDTSCASTPTLASPLISATKVMRLLQRDGSGTVTLVLSLMALLVGAYSIGNLGPDTALLFLFCLLLALHGIYQLLRRAESAHESGTLTGRTFRVVLHEHSFASVDGAGVTEDDPVSSEKGDGEDVIPKRFIDGCEGNMTEARRRWDITRNWRLAEKVDDILGEKQPFYHKIKEYYPHHNAGRGKQGHVIYWERPGEIDLGPLAKFGVSTDALCRHWIFVTEFQWAVLCKGDETAKSIAVIDVKGVGISDLVGPKLECVKRCVGMANQHYPERSLVVYFVNASWFFTSVWAVIKPWVHPNTQKKVGISIHLLSFFYQLSPFLIYHFYFGTTFRRFESSVQTLKRY